MQRRIITTADGSKTIQIEDWNEQYHSIHGAIQEANHVYIKMGLLFYLETYKLSQNNADLSHNLLEAEISILEIGFGTGLNAFLTLIEAEKQNLKMRYVAVEAFPITQNEITALNYVEELHVIEKTELFAQMHNIAWSEEVALTAQFSLHKQQKLFQDITDKNCFNLIYFDAFGARVQPELWTESMFQIMYDALKDTGVLVTYSAKGSVRRAMIAVGFSVEKLPGPPGKREMLRGTKHTT